MSFEYFGDETISTLRGVPTPSAALNHHRSEQIIVNYGNKQIMKMKEGNGIRGIVHIPI